MENWSLLPGLAWASCGLGIGCPHHLLILPLWCHLLPWQRGDHGLGSPTAALLPLLTIPHCSLFQMCVPKQPPSETDSGPPQAKVEYLIAIYSSTLAT